MCNTLVVYIQLACSIPRREAHSFYAQISFHIVYVPQPFSLSFSEIFFLFLCRSFSFGFVKFLYATPLVYM